MAATSHTTSLPVASREVAGSRAARRLRRSGYVPGVIYGGSDEPVAFQVGALLLRNTLAHAGAVIELSLDEATASPVVIKEIVRHPVSGDIQHVDLLRVRMDETINTSVLIDLVGAESAPGVIEGGVLEQVLREVAIEALPGDIPDSIQHDVSTLEVAGTLTLAELRAPSGVTFLDDLESVVATITAPRLQTESETEIETETGLVGEEGAEADAAAQASEGETGDGSESGSSEE